MSVTGAIPIVTEPLSVAATTTVIAWLFHANSTSKVVSKLKAKGGRTLPPQCAAAAPVVWRPLSRRPLLLAAAVVFAAMLLLIAS